MKKIYNTPEFKVIEINSEDIIQTSGEEVTATPKTTVGGVEAYSLQATNVDVFQ